MGLALLAVLAFIFGRSVGASKPASTSPPSPGSSPSTSPSSTSQPPVFQWVGESVLSGQAAPEPPAGANPIGFVIPFLVLRRPTPDMSSTSPGPRAVADVRIESVHKDPASANGSYNYGIGVVTVVRSPIPGTIYNDTPKLGDRVFLD